MKIYRLLTVVVIAALTYGLSAEVGLADNSAPEPVVSEWINKDPGTLMSMKGKVVVIDFFQMWCPGCNNFSVPLMFQLEDKYKKRDDIEFMSIHTVFEGHAYQTPADLKEYVIEKGIKHPVGIDAYDSGQYTPITMKKYRTGGTPCITIIDKNGYIRFKKLGSFNSESAFNVIDRLLRE
ncbi:MAG: TlpA family protein disulfide reductase [Candidatus Anammoxibacter sp.]